jgi:hypothetical protein
MTKDLACPSCGDGRVRRLPKVGHREDYVCPVCFAFSVSGSDWPAIKAGARSSLFLKGERVWLRPNYRDAPGERSVRNLDAPC